jgi:hypothetical protein
MVLLATAAAERAEFGPVADQIAQHEQKLATARAAKSVERRGN